MKQTRYHLGLDAGREGVMSAPYHMSMIHVRIQENGHTIDTWKHVATCAIARLVKEYKWTLLETKPCA